MDSLLTAIRELDRRGRLFEPGESVLVGCSGGADSLALTHALRALAPETGWRVQAAYVHHGLRAAADDEAERLTALMTAWQVPFRVVRIEVDASGKSPEEAARDARYQALNQVAETFGATALVLGHHADDQIETVLLRLAKGSALPGLLGIPMVRSQASGPRIVRPLLETPRSEIEAYLGRHGLSWFEDESNRDVTVPRNRIRHHVVPDLLPLNPALHRTLSANLGILSDEHDLLEAMTREAMQRLVRIAHPGLIGWEAEGFGELPRALQRRILAHAYEYAHGSRRGLTAERVERMRALLEAGGGPHDIGSGLRVLSQHGWHVVDRPVAPLEPQLALIDGPSVQPWGVRLETVGPSTPAEPRRSEVFDADGVPSDLVWRQARPERDRFTPWGHQNAHTLGHYLAKARIPRPMRERLVVLACGDDVLWIVGMQRGVQAPISRASRSAIRALREGRAWFDNAWSDPYHEADS